MTLPYGKTRLYLFTRREPVDTEEATGGRDIFNEKPLAEEMVNASDLAATSSTSLARTAIIHTTLGDIHIKLFPDEVGRCRLTQGRSRLDWAWLLRGASPPTLRIWGFECNSPEFRRL